MTLIKPITTEKAIRMLELENKITFLVDRRSNKIEIRKEMEKAFNVKVEGVTTQIKNNKKTAIIKLKEESPAIDVATKLGLI
ncbi:MAG: 50S ribosomal protein L23 [Nanoarchaeota archaeon]|nr:50S ribosomal protein L23 [Nanoarchaeota archaeon]